MERFIKELDSRRLYLCENIGHRDWQYVYITGTCDFEEKLEGVLKKIDIGEEEVLLIYDDSLFGKGTSGFIITNAAIYNIEENKRLGYKSIRKIELSIGEYKFITTDGIYKLSCKKLKEEKTL